MNALSFKYSYELLNISTVRQASDIATMQSTQRKERCLQNWPWIDAIHIMSKSYPRITHIKTSTSAASQLHQLELVKHSPSWHIRP